MCLILLRQSMPSRAYSRMLARQRAWLLTATVEGELLLLPRRRLLKSEEECQRASYECMYAETTLTNLLANERGKAKSTGASRRTTPSERWQKRKQ